jgi:hypothetical protein
VDPHSFLCFVELNFALGESERTIAWLRSATPQQATRLRVHSLRRILELVEEGELLAHLGRLLDDGIARAEEYRSFSEERLADPPVGFTEDDLARARRRIREASAKFARKLAQALRAAERVPEASQLEKWSDELVAQKN